MVDSDVYNVQMAGYYSGLGSQHALNNQMDADNDYIDRLLDSISHPGRYEEPEEPYTPTTNIIPDNTYAEETLGGGGKSIVNTQRSNTVISGTSYADYVYSRTNNVTVYGGAGSDTLTGSGIGVALYGGDGNDSIGDIGSNVLAVGGAGDDTIKNGNSGVTIYGGAGNDSVYSFNATINTGAGDDTIKLSSGKNVIQYSNGDGNDLIQNFSSSDTLRIYGSYATQESGDNVLVQVGSGMIILEGAKGQPLNIETSSAAFPTPAGDITAPTNTTGTPDFNFGNTNSTASTNSGSGYLFTGGGTPIFNFLTSTTGGSVRIYAGGDQVISDYVSGDQIIFGGGNFALTSPTGTLFIQNANDKIIDFTDGAGNPYAKAYAATNPGVIDGRGLAGYEVITGSDFGSDWLYAGDGGSQLWGGSGFGQDILTGGGGADIFIGGKNQGADVIFNAGSADMVNLNDATLSDIVAASEANGVIALAFNNGNAVAIQSSEVLSAAFVLADGSAYRYNHAAKVWQNA